jgi:hypothetical protein
MITLFPPALASTIAQAIRHETHNRVRNLGIEQDGPDVIVRGRAASYYIKQLAHRAALDFLEGGHLFNEIQVGPAPAPRRGGIHLHTASDTPYFPRSRPRAQDAGSTAATALSTSM